MEFDLAKALEEQDPSDVGHRLKAARLEAGLKQPQAAAGVVSVGYLSRIERGERRANAFVLAQLCKNIGVPVEVIVRGGPVPDARSTEVQLDFAELELLSGEAATALARIKAIAGGEAADHNSGSEVLTERTTLLTAKAQAAMGLTTDALANFEAALQSQATPSGTVEAALGLSRLSRETGDLRKAALIAETVLADLERANAPIDDITRISMALAAAVYEAGDVNRALDICRQAIAAAEGAGSAKARAAAYWNTAIMECEAGRMEEALVLTRRALAVFAGADDARLEARLRTQLGIFLLRSEPPEPLEAIEQLTVARDAFKVTDADVSDVLHNRMALARALFAAGEVPAATAEAEFCVDQGSDFPFVGATAATLLGTIANSQGSTEEARSAFLRAIHFLSAVGADRRAAQQWFTLATLLDDAGLDAEAKDAFRRAAVSTGLTPSYGSAGSHLGEIRSR